MQRESDAGLYSTTLPLFRIINITKYMTQENETKLVDALKEIADCLKEIKSDMHNILINTYHMRNH